VRQLLGGRWRVYDQNELLLETTPPYRTCSIKDLKAKTSKDQN